MGKSATDTRAVINGDKKGKQPASNHGAPLFFNQRPISPTSETAGTQQPVQQIHLETNTEFLLAAILEELKTRNMLALMKLKLKQAKEQEELQTSEEKQAEDAARFEEIRPSMYT